MSNKTYVNLSHYDLDGVGCHILLKALFKEVKHYCCGYGKFEKFLDRMIMEQEDTDILFVTDWTLTLETFEKIKRFYGDKFLYFDHHESSLDNLKGAIIKGKIDPTISATMIIFRQFESKLKVLPEYTQLKRLVEYVDAYDCWRTSSPDFKWGYALTELFYIYNWNDFVSRFSDGFEGFTSKESESVKTSVKKRWKKLEAEGKFLDIKGLDKDALVFMMGDADGFINDLTLLDRTANYFFAYNTKENKISVRLRNVVDKDISKVFSKLLKDDKSIKSYGGHKHAGAFWFNEEDPDIESYIKDIYKELKKEK